MIINECGTVSYIIKVKLISKPGTDTDFQFVSHQHLNFEIQILLESGYDQ